MTPADHDIERKFHQIIIAAAGRRCLQHRLRKSAESNLLLHLNIASCNQIHHRHARLGLNSSC